MHYPKDFYCQQLLFLNVGRAVAVQGETYEILEEVE